MLAEPLSRKIDTEIERVLPEIISIRRSLHQAPELSGQEFKTAARIRDWLSGTQLQLLPPFLRTDVVGLLQGARQGYNVTLRADTDALPMQETSGVSWRSQAEGVTHGCGHDGHTAILLGTAWVLDRLRDAVTGSIRFVFQPGEENGALGRNLVEAGAIDDPPPRAVYALHAHATVPVGTVKTMAGVLMAAIARFTIRVRGRSAISSEPQKFADPLSAAAYLVAALQSIVSRQISPLDNAILSVAHFHADNIAGDAPCEACLEGSARYLKPEVGAAMRELITRQLQGLDTMFGTTHTLEWTVPYETSYNDPACVARLKRVVTETYGPEGYREMEAPSMGSEDFCFFLKRYPGAFFNLGIGEDRPYCHNPAFDFNDEALRYGIDIMVRLALETLAEP
jgi:hippurate hydrolase